MEEALASALKVFWRKGYEAATLTDLTDAMGITRPSLYCAFGNKEELFKKALDLYEREKLAFIDQAMSKPTAYETVQFLLLKGADAHSDPETPGCMSVNSVLTCGGVASDSVRQELANRRLNFESKLRDRFERAKREGDIRADVDVSSLTAYVLALAQGMALQASMGMSLGELRGIVNMALQSWPCGRAEAVAAA